MDLGLIGTTGIPLPLELEDEDKAVVGLLCSFKKEEPGFLFWFTAHMRRIDFLVCIWPSQQEKLKYYGDLMLIDSTFGISLRGYRALNVVVVDQHFRSVLVATSFTVSESGGIQKDIGLHKQCHTV